MPERIAWSVPEVAVMFGLSERTVYLACRSGSLPTLPREITGDRVLVPAHNLAERVALMATGNKPTHTGEQQ